MNGQHDFDDAVIEHCAAMGVQVTRAQLDRWKRAGGLLAAVGSAAATLDSDLAAAGQVCALVGELRRHRHLPTAVFALWLKGYRVGLPAVRAFLIRRARLHDEFVTEVRAAGFTRAGSTACCMTGRSLPDLKRAARAQLRAGADRAICRTVRATR